MYMLHAWEGEVFEPVIDSITTSEILSSRPRSELESGGEHLDMWNRTFAEVEQMAEDTDADTCSLDRGKEYFYRLLRMAVSRDERILSLAEKYFTISDLIAIGNRIIGSGLIGGKSVGLLLARAILRKDNPRVADILEVHDSFYIASDVFYTFLVRNGCWWLRQSLRNPEGFVQVAKEARRLILRGSFPDYLVTRFSDMLDYFGQSPIIVRSSSLLEDNFGNAFAGKYESVFCANQGSRTQRLADFISAIRTVYASTLSENALRYRAKRGLLEQDEQMSLLVQRVSGSRCDSLFYPHMAGVGYSFNPYVWSDDIDPESGMLRMVFGLGTRAVDRTDDDFTRLVALNAPQRRPGMVAEDPIRYSQRKVDVIDLGANQLVAKDFSDVVRESPCLPVKLFGTAATSSGDRSHGHLAGIDPSRLTLTFDPILENTGFVNDMREMLDTLEKAYDHPVDVEFTCNVLADQSHKINLVQCRPLQMKGTGRVVQPPDDLTDDDIVLRTSQAVVGQSRVTEIDGLIYVVPADYDALSLSDKYEVARLIGRVVHSQCQSCPTTIMLIGPGRWGTTTPSLGVPVTFAEINRVSVLCEVAQMRDNLVPEISFGSHFFSEIVEMEMLYLALSPGAQDAVLKESLLLDAPNKLNEFLQRRVASLPQYGKSD